MLMTKLLACLLLATTTTNAGAATRVVVTGGAGRTGSLVFSKLLKNSSFEPIALVRSSSSLPKITKLGASSDQCVVCDITNPEELTKKLKELKAEKLVLCTSAVPKINNLSLVKTILSKLIGQSSRPSFTFPNGDPYSVDWLGAKNQIDAAKAAGVKQFVFLSSMGGTQPDNFLNTIGKVEGQENSGNILLWKRKAEQYLIKSGLPYTIIHPGGLLDKRGGEREIVLGINGKLKVITCVFKSYLLRDSFIFIFLVII